MSKNLRALEKVIGKWIAVWGAVHFMAPSAYSKPLSEFSISQARRQIVALQVLDRNEQVSGVEFTAGAKQSAQWKRVMREFSILPDSNAYAENDSCLVAGWEGVIREGRCRVSEEVREMSISASEELSPEVVVQRAFSEVCGANEVACNPEVFGFRDNAGLSERGLYCVSRSEDRMTMGCLRMSLGEVAMEELPLQARKDTDSFSRYLTGNPQFFSDSVLKRWAEKVNMHASGSPYAGTVMQRAREVCSQVAVGTSRDRNLISEIEEELAEVRSFAEQRASERRIFQAEARISRRDADLRDCQILKTVSFAAEKRGGQPEVADHLQGIRGEASTAFALLQDSKRHGDGQVSMSDSR